MYERCYLYVKAIRVRTVKDNILPVSWDSFAELGKFAGICKALVCGCGTALLTAGDVNTTHILVSLDYIL